MAAEPGSARAARIRDRMGSREASAAAGSSMTATSSTAPGSDRQKNLSRRDELSVVRLQLRGAGQHRPAAGGEAGAPVAQGGFQRLQASGLPYLGDERGDLLQQVAAAPELVGEPGVPYVGLVVDAV